MTFTVDFANVKKALKSLDHAIICLQSSRKTKKLEEEKYTTRKAVNEIPLLAKQACII